MAISRIESAIQFNITADINAKIPLTNEYEIHTKMNEYKMCSHIFVFLLKKIYI